MGWWLFEPEIGQTDGDEGEDGLKPLLASLGDARGRESGLGLEMEMALEMGEKGEGEELEEAGADEALDRMPKSDLALLVTARMRLSGP
ncbi:hypothetical protein Nepgr_001864 [Nepenthes gracilis]|uniref:Uncharacterized protein n=1 Tax=Nepenthes gracilis TaxID=150966 RepID=A0AAD3P6W5_NEPGR|nr:hypothetical protein Nepgr_001864 [Nepenthes gracilis]